MITGLEGGRGWQVKDTELLEAGKGGEQILP